MACYHPKTAYQVHNAGTRKVTFKRPRRFAEKVVVITLPCGYCPGCRFEHAKMWAVRCSHEAQMHQDNAFITLTFNDYFLPKNGSLDHRFWQRFMKRLRKRFPGTRYFMSGEYGRHPITGTIARPHFHALLFGQGFRDRHTPRKGEGGFMFYQSKELDELWREDNSSIGFASVGELTFKSCAYVARYIMKKQNGINADGLYRGLDRETGELLNPHCVDEYSRMSTDPGLGRSWIEKFASDVYPSDEVVLNGKTYRVPRYYDRVVSKEVGEMFLAPIKDNRIAAAAANADNNTPERLAVREKVLQARLTKLKRTLT